MLSETSPSNDSIYSVSSPEKAYHSSVLHDVPAIEKLSSEPGLPLRQLSTISYSSSDDKSIIPLPPKHHPRPIRHARHTFLNVYRRLFSVVFALNAVGAGIISWRFYGNYQTAFLGHLATAASANIMVALLARQDYIINAMFRVCWSVPLSAPLRLRRILTKVYEYGGVHSGAAVASVVWYALFTGFLTNQFVKSTILRSPAVLTITYVLLAVLICIVITAYPRFRFSSHNTFENLHRWGGWFSLALFWAELVLFIHAQTPHIGPELVKQPSFYFLLISSLHAIFPWIRLHKLEVTAEKLSNHAIRLHFTEPVPLFVGLRVSDAPLKEWHSFACIPARSGPGGSILISNAGDWTKRTIQNPKPYYWIKGVPVTGVLCMACIFRRVIVVTTGSGIGPCLAVIQDIPTRGTRCRVIWSTPSPLETYGNEICDSVKAVDKEAVIIDTRKGGRPDLVAMAWDLYCRQEAEAVFVISNPKLTRKVVYGLEARGVPAFGPIFDS